MECNSGSCLRAGNSSSEPKVSQALCDTGRGLSFLFLFTGNDGGQRGEVSSD